MCLELMCNSSKGMIANIQDRKIWALIPHSVSSQVIQVASVPRELILQPFTPSSKTSPDY